MAVSLSNTDKLSLISNLGTMLTAGIPILEAVESLLEDVKGGQKKVLEGLKKDLNQGKTISDSFKKFPGSFDPVTVNLIKASEEAGTLDETLKNLSQTIKRDIEFTDKVKAALTYPAAVFVVFGLVLLLILIIVIPRIASVFSKLKIDLPLPTQILIYISNFMLKFTPFFIALVVGFIILVIFLYKKEKKLLFNIFFSVPPLSNLAKLIDLTRFTRSMGLLLSSGIPITDALELSKNVVSERRVYRAVSTFNELVSSGKELSEGLKKTRGVFPGMMIRVTEAGEKTGTLDKGMEDLSEYFDDQVTNSLKTLTTLLEPIMLVIMGILIGGIMLSIIAPIYGLIGQIRSR